MLMLYRLWRVDGQEKIVDYFCPGADDVSFVRGRRARGKVDQDQDFGIWASTLEVRDLLVPVAICTL